MLDLFAGCGGFGSGIAATDRFRVRLAVDSWNKAAIAHSQNMPSCQFLHADLAESSVRRKLVSELRDEIDLIVGGPPCQPFSTLGKRQTLDKRRDLVEMYCWYVRSIAPKVAIMENVRGFASLRGPDGRSYPERIKSALSRRIKNKPAYFSSARLIDFGGFGLAQSRPRWVTVAIREDCGDLKATELLMQSICQQASLPLGNVRQAFQGLPRVVPCGGANYSRYRGSGVHNHKSLNHSAELIHRLSFVPAGGGLLDVPRRLLTDHLRRLVDGAYGSGGHVKNIYGRLEWGKPSGTVVAGIDKITCGRFVHPVENRLLTPRECARLQSFPDEFAFMPSLVASYYLIGNAVPPKAAAAMGRSVASFLDQNGSTASRKTIKSAR